jgi:hypothetical protein
MAADLDNPLWSSLTTLHRPFARTPGRRDRGASTPDAAAPRDATAASPRVVRYPADVAPFLAVEHEGARVDAELAELVAAGETVLLIGPRPVVPAGWQLDDFGSILQMVCDRPPAAGAGERAGSTAEATIRELGAAERPAILALTALVYPHYFRPRTPELGRYFGIYVGNTLAAMAGERMGFPGHREISAVCTHPDFVGRGLARRLLDGLGADISAGGALPFLHVSPTNTRAIRLYEQNGYRVRREIPFAALRRA